MNDTTLNLPTPGKAKAKTALPLEITTKLSLRMKTTKSNRFNCAKRLEKRVATQSFVLNFLSLLTVLAGVYLLAFASNLTTTGAQFVGVFSIGVSVLAIFISRQDTVDEMSKRATDAHRCGREVSHVYRQLEAGTLTAVEASEEYEKIVSSYEGNHDRCDFMMTLRDYKTEMAAEAKQRGANWFSSVFASNFSAFSPAIFAILGVILIIGVCLTTPIINRHFQDLEGSVAQQENLGSEAKQDDQVAE